MTVLSLYALGMCLPHKTKVLKIRNVQVPDPQSETFECHSGWCSKFQTLQMMIWGCEFSDQRQFVLYKITFILYIIYKNCTLYII